MQEDLFTASTVLRATGITYRQLDYILRCGVISASGGGGCGRGDPRYFSLSDLVALRVAQELLSTGMPLHFFSAALRVIQHHPAAPSEKMANSAVCVVDKKVAIVQTRQRPKLGRGSSAVGHIIHLRPAVAHVLKALERCKRA